LAFLETREEAEGYFLGVLLHNLCGLTSEQECVIQETQALYNPSNAELNHAGECFREYPFNLLTGITSDASP
jgi:hypothetical protein